MQRLTPNHGLSIIIELLLRCIFSRDLILEFGDELSVIRVDVVSVGLEWSLNPEFAISCSWIIFNFHSHIACTQLVLAVHLDEEGTTLALIFALVEVAREGRYKHECLPTLIIPELISEQSLIPSLLSHLGVIPLIETLEWGKHHWCELHQSQSVRVRILCCSSLFQLQISLLLLIALNIIGVVERCAVICFTVVRNQFYRLDE